MMNYRADSNSKIILLFPADNWHARIKRADDSIFDSPLICWALIESEGEQEIVGMAATDEVDYADEDVGFVCYIHASEIARNPPHKEDKKVK
jgi:hypothetical protein